MELPGDNMTVSFFPSEKKLLFSPQDHTAVTSKLRTYVHMMKQEFKVDDVQFMQNGTFTIEFDPREDFQKVMNFVAEFGAI